jgi:hypothetical protein
MKRTDIKRLPLADTVLAALEPEAKDYYQNYGADRLYFLVTSGVVSAGCCGTKSPMGNGAGMGWGPPGVSAKCAREKARAALKLNADGVDPITHKAALKAAQALAEANTFKVAADLWLEKKIKDGRAEKTLKGIGGALKNDILPALGHKPLDHITRGDCANLQARIEKRGAHNTSEKVRVWVNQIFALAIAKGMTENNPASNLLAIAEKAPPENQYPHLLEEERRLPLPRIDLPSPHGVIQH